MMLLPRITVVRYGNRSGLLCWSDEDGSGLEFSDGSRRVVNTGDLVFVRYIEDGEDWTIQ